ncbi:MAG TPA: hypothetical protein VH834_18255 [Solirubrobacteraceae bacterium]|jgi:hypothetical protein
MSGTWSPREKGSAEAEPFVHPQPHPNVPSGLAEELGLARAAVAEYDALARGLWSERYYARARHYFALAAAEREHVRALEAVR